MRLLSRALVVVSSVAIAVLAWRYVRPAAPAPAEEQTNGPPRPVATGPIEPAALMGTYQGPITRADGSEEWLVLEITRVTVASDDRVTFAFTLSSSSDAVREEGTASLRDRRIRFAGLSGEIRTREDGALVLRSAPIAGPPHWMLERPRSEPKSAGETQT